jgi:predicted negative regulator of RcsB-dependent stress response
MSEQQFTRVEKAIEGLETTKTWFRNSALAFIAASILTIGSVARNEYRLNRAEDNMSRAASIKSVELLKDSFESNSNALLNLVDENYKTAAEQFIKETQKINENIFMYSTQVTRGGTSR